MYLIVGLGNPGKKYEQTRHNVGFLVVEKLAKELDIQFAKKSAVEAEIADGMLGKKKVLLCKPNTFMNASGRSVKSIISKYPIESSDIIVVYDDADLKFADIRFKMGGSSAGHNGIESIIESFPKGTNIARVRVGIGRPAHNDTALEDFVLQKWTEQESKDLESVIDNAIKTVKNIIEGV